MASETEFAEAPQGDVVRQPWNMPRIVNTTPAREAETGVNPGPEILILVS